MNMSIFGTISTMAIVPPGIVVMWSGSSSSVPVGWLICDGTDGTPDLRSRFIIGAGSSYDAGAKGGSSVLQLSLSNLPSHTHNVTASFVGEPLASHTHGVADPGHSHSFLIYPSDTSGSITGGPPAQANGGHTNPIWGYTSASGTGIAISAASSGTPSGTVTTTIDFVGNGEPVSVLPPFYALLYIMKVSG